MTIDYKIEECIWKNYLGEKKRRVESEYGCNKCSGKEQDCHQYIPERKYIKEVSKRILEGRLL